jgi:predicted Zn-dependent peptidase
LGYRHMLKPIILKNGLTILRLPKSSSNVFLAGFVASTGSAVEEGYFPQGISHLVGRLFWRGTDKHPGVRNLNLALENMGGDFYSRTNHELTQFYLTVPAYHQFKAISMLAEVIQHSYFEERDIDREKKALVEKIKQVEEGASSELDKLSISNLYQNHSLGLNTEGTIDSILSITQENILEYLAHQYRPDKSFLVLSGNFDSKAAVELVEQEWNFWNPRTKKFIEPLPFVTDDAGVLPRLSYRQRGLPQTGLAVGFLLEGGLQPHLPEDEPVVIESKNTGKKDETKPDKPNDKEVEADTKKLLDEMLTDWSKLLVLNCVLGDGLSSRLWTKTVDEEMFFATIKSRLNLFRTTGFLDIGGVTDNSQFTFALESIFSVLESLKKTTVSINELAKAKEYIKGKLLVSQEDLLTATIWQMEHLIGSGLTFELSDLLQKIDKVDTASLRSLALDLFVPSRMALTTLGTAKETRLVEKLIKKYLG